MTLAYLKKNLTLASIGIGYLVLVSLNAIGINCWLPPCLVTMVTGYHCLGCGLNRAAIQLLQGNPEGALYTNSLIFLYIPAGIAIILFDYRNFTKKIPRLS